MVVDPCGCILVEQVDGEEADALRPQLGGEIA